MRDDEYALLICNPRDAEYLLSKDPDFKDVLVITNVMPVGEMVMVPQQEFIDYVTNGHTTEEVKDT